jgi:hypothetical protein
VISQGALHSGRRRPAAARRAPRSRAESVPEAAPRRPVPRKPLPIWRSAGRPVRPDVRQVAADEADLRAEVLYGLARAWPGGRPARCPLSRPSAPCARGRGGEVGAPQKPGAGDGEIVGEARRRPTAVVIDCGVHVFEADAGRGVVYVTAAAVVVPVSPSLSGPVSLDVDVEGSPGQVAFVAAEGLAGAPGAPSREARRVGHTGRGRRTRSRLTGEQRWQAAAAECASGVQGASLTSGTAGVLPAAGLAGVLPAADPGRNHTAGGRADAMGTLVAYPLHDRPQCWTGRAAPGALGAPPGQI